MPLILQPTFSDKTREEIEQHLLVVRARRMAAVAMYYAGKNAKTNHLIAKEQQRVNREYALLVKDLDKMNALEQKIEERMITLEQHWQELQRHHGNLVEIEDGDDRPETGKHQRKSFESNSRKPPGY
jgi:hypothetical protein